MAEFLERIVMAAVPAELGRALTVIYTRHGNHGTVRQAMRGLLATEHALLREFDALDDLDAAFSLGVLCHFTLEEELTMLYWQHRQAGAAEVLAALRRLCAHEPAWLAAFDRLDATTI